MAHATVIVQFRAKPGQGPALAAALSKAIQGTITKKDCYQADLHVDDDDPERLYLYEKWTSAEAHKAYAQGIMSDPKMEALLSLMQGPPDSTYLTMHASGGGRWGGPAHLELISADAASTRAFFTKVFDWQFTELMEGYDGFWAPGALMGGLRPKADDDPAPAMVPYLVVDDIEARLERVQAAGGNVVVPIQQIPDVGRFFWFVEPGGVVFAVWQDANRL